MEKHEEQQRQGHKSYAVEKSLLSLFRNPGPLEYRLATFSLWPKKGFWEDGFKL
ncbi:TPA: hypothetical protein ACXNHL_000170 [Serratia marcescens]